MPNRARWVIDASGGWAKQLGRAVCKQSGGWTGGLAGLRGWDGSLLWTRHRLPLEPLTECCDGNAVCLLAWSGVQNCRVLSTSLCAGGEGNRLGCVSWRNAAAGQHNRQGVLVVLRSADCVASVHMSVTGGKVFQAGRWRAGGGQVVNGDSGAGGWCCAAVMRCRWRPSTFLCWFRQHKRDEVVSEWGKVGSYIHFAGPETIAGALFRCTQTYAGSGTNVDQRTAIIDRRKLADAAQ